MDQSLSRRKFFKLAAGAAVLAAGAPVAAAPVRPKQITVWFRCERAVRWEWPVGPSLGQYLPTDGGPSILDFAE